MNNNTIERSEKNVLIYTRFNRLWHWSQVLSILTLLFTGLRIAGIHNVLTFETAVKVHTFTAIALAVLWIFIFFWLVTTGNWKQYIPTGHGMMAVIRYYSFGVFKGEEHPYHRIIKRRLNPLQATAYLALNIVLIPAIWISGILYLFSSFFNTNIGLIANIHTVAAFAIAAFIIVHVYMLTFGHGFKKHVRSMITGYDKVDVTQEEYDYLVQNEPNKIKDKA